MNLFNLINLLLLYRKQHLQYLSKNDDDEYTQVFALGNTGCGKSTMLVSLIEGPDALQEVYVKKKVVRNKKTTVHRQKVIGRKVVEDGDGE